MDFEQLRSRCMRAIVALVAAASIGWWFLRGADWREETARFRSEASALQQRNAAARAAAVSLGDSALDDSIRIARHRFQTLQERVPVNGPAAPAMVQSFRHLAERAGAEVRRQEEIAPAPEGAFVSEGVRFCVVGSFEAVGTWLAQVVTTPQLVQIREVALDPVPDSLVAPLALPAGPQETGGAAVASTPCTQGEQPFRVVASVALRWFRHTPPQRDSTVP